MVGIGVALAAGFIRYFLMAGSGGIVRGSILGIGVIGLVMIFVGLAMASRDKKG
jgi:hypothetical protein